MATNRRWVLYNTLTKNLIMDGSSPLSIPYSEHQVKIDINNGDDAVVTVPAYSLSDDYRLNAPERFKAWSRGIALIDDTKVWNDPGKVIWAGPIVKHSYSTKSEEINLTAFSFGEHFKKQPIIPIWSTVTDQTAHEVIESGSWGGVMTKLIQRSTSATGADAGWQPIGTAQMGTFPSTAGTGFSVDIKTTQQRTVYSVMEDIRDEISANGNEFRFIPRFSSNAMTAIVFDMVVGTESEPHINLQQSNPVEVPLSETDDSSTGWGVSNYELESDHTMTYNKIVINGSTDPATGNLQQANNLSDMSVPSMTEVFDAGTTLDSTQMTKQLNSRMKNSLIASKAPRLEITNDKNFDFLGYLGQTLNITPGVTSAGWGAIVRAVGLTITGSDDEMVVDVDCMRIQDRYPKLPSDVEKESDGYGDAPYGGDPMPDYNTGGELPQYPEFGDDNNPNDFMAVYKPMANIQQTTYGWDNLYSNVYNNKFLFSLSNWGYSRGASTSTFSNFILRTHNLNVNSTTNNNPTITSITETNYDFSSYISANFSPVEREMFASITGSGTPATLNSYENRWAYIWAIKDKLYVLVTITARYNQGVPYRGSLTKQGLFTLDINPTTGLLSNPQTLSAKFTPWSNYDHIFFAPYGGSEAYSSNGKRFIPEPPIQIGSDTIIFPSVTSIKDIQWYNNTSYDYRIYNQNMGSLIFEGIVNPIWQGDFSSPTLPKFGISNKVSNLIPPYRNLTANTTVDHMTVNGLKKVTNVTSGTPPVFYQNMVNDVHNKVLYAFPHGGTATQNNTYYNKDKPSNWVDWQVDFRGDTVENPFNSQDPAKTILKNGQIFKLDYGKGETSWSKFGGRYNDKLSDTTGAISYSGIPTQDGVFIPQPENWNNYGRAGYGLYVTSTGTKTVPGVVAMKMATFTGASQDITRNDFPQSALYRNKIPQQVMDNLWITNTTTVYSNDYDANSGIRAQTTFQPNIFKKKVLFASGNALIDTDNGLWMWKKSAGCWGIPKIWEQNQYAQKIGSAIWITVASTPDCTLAIDSSGYLWGWGTNVSILGGTVSIPTQIGTSKWKKVAIGTNFAVAIRDDGKLHSWGSNASGATGMATATGTTATPTLVAGTASTKNFIEISAGGAFSMAIDDTRDLYRTGTLAGLTGRTSYTIEGADKWLHVSAGTTHFLLIKYSDSSLWVAGTKLRGVTGISGTTGSIGITQITTAPVSGVLFKQVAAISNSASYALSTDGRLFATGFAQYGSTTNTTVWYEVAASGTGANLFHEIEDIYSIYDSVGIKYKQFFASTYHGAADDTSVNAVQNQVQTGGANSPFYFPVFGVYPITKGSDGVDIPPEWGDGGMIGA